MSCSPSKCCILSPILSPAVSTIVYSGSKPCHHGMPGPRHRIVLCCIAVIHIQLYTYTCRNKIKNNDERTHFFRKIYLSHFIRNGFESVAKGLCVRGNLETEQTATYWPPVPLSSAALLSRSAGMLNRGSWGPLTFCWVWFSLPQTVTNWLQLTEPDCGTGLYNCLTYTCFLWASHLHPIQPVNSQGFTLICSTGCTCYLHRCISYLTDQLRVNMLHMYFTVVVLGSRICQLHLCWAERYVPQKYCYDTKPSEIEKQSWRLGWMLNTSYCHYFQFNFLRVS